LNEGAGKTADFNRIVFLIDGRFWLLRPTLFDPSNPEISGFELGKESLPARAKKAGNATSQIRRI
jgi:hypothetical protein